MALQSSQRLPELLFYTKKSYKILQSSNSSSNPTRTHYREFSIQNPILHTEDRELFEYYNSTHRRQGDLLEMHPCVLQDIPGNSSCSRDIQDIPVIHDLPAFPCIFYNSTVSTVRLVSTENSTEYQLGNYRHYKHSFFKEREMLRYRSRCQDDIFPRIELIPSFVLSSDNTNCKNDIQLFHQLFDELSVHTDYH